MFRRTLLALTLASAVGIVCPGAFAADPSLSEVYRATAAGRLGDAETMMKQVLRDHPNSAKAHYVEAEVLASAGHRTEGLAELDLARQLAPGLPFAKPEAVQHLEARLVAPGSGGQPTAGLMPATSGHGTLLVALGIAGALLLVFLLRRQTTQVPAAVYPPAPFGSATGASAAVPMAPATAQSGLGSGLMGSLATGAALGVGVVAGEALMHRVMGGEGPIGRNPDSPASRGWQDQELTPVRLDQDPAFGVTDASSWDDDSSVADEDDTGDNDWT